MMSSTDTHQGHQVVHAESVRALRGRTVLGYETPWNQRIAHTTLFAELEQADVDTKIAMTAEYRSQADLGRSYVSPDFIRSAATFRAGRRDRGTGPHRRGHDRADAAFHSDDGEAARFARM